MAAVYSDVISESSGVSAPSPSLTHKYGLRHTGESVSEVFSKELTLLEMRERDRVVDFVKEFFPLVSRSADAAHFLGQYRMYPTLKREIGLARTRFIVMYDKESGSTLAVLRKVMEMSLHDFEGELCRLSTRVVLRH